MSASFQAIGYATGGDMDFQQMPRTIQGYEADFEKTRKLHRKPWSSKVD
ncbi:MAG: hypothetical protein RL090_197 [Bacteroidota bacterium]|jgi:hypothetical protein